MNELSQKALIQNAFVEKIFSRLNWLEDALLILSLSSLVLLAFLQILLRNLWDTGIIWGDSFLRVLVLWVTMFGAMIATREQSHIKIDLLAKYLSNAWQPRLQFISGLFASIICALAAYYSWQLMVLEYEDATIAFSKIPVWLCQSILPLGFLVMAIRFFIQAIKSLLSLRKEA